MFSKSRFTRYYIYFRRGHANYLAFFIALANFIVIQYRLLIEYIPTLEMFFQNMLMFLLLFLAVYIPLVVIIGWYDYKRFMYPQEATIHAEANPYFRKLTAKEKIVWGYMVSVLEVLEKEAEEKGLDTSKIKEAKEKVQELLKG